MRKDLIIDLGVSVTGFVTDVLGKAAIPGLSMGTMLLKRGLETYSANQYLKNEGIRRLVVFKHLCDNLEVLVSRQPKTEELTYIFSLYKELRKNVDDILKALNSSVYSDILKRAYDDYPGKDKKTEAIDKIIKLELIPAIVHFIHKDLGENKTFDSFVDMHLASFDNDKLHDVWLEIWQTKGYNMLYNSYSEFIDAQIKDNKGKITGKGNSDKFEAFKKNMERWQLYMDTLSSFTELGDIHLFLLNYKQFRPAESRTFDIIKFAKNYMIDPIDMEDKISGTIESLKMYIDALLTLTRLNQTGGGSRSKGLVRRFKNI